MLITKFALFFSNSVEKPMNKSCFENHSVLSIAKTKFQEN